MSTALPKEAYAGIMLLLLSRKSKGQLSDFDVWVFARTRLVLALAVFCITGRCFPCMVCASNLSYNGIRFTPLWVIALAVWALIAFAVWLITKRANPGTEIGRMYLRPALKYFAIVLGLYIIGLHLVAILLLPVMLIRVVFIKSRKTLSAEDTAPQRWLTRAGGLFLALLVVAVPVGYLALPQVVSEVETRVRAQRTKDTLQEILKSSSSSRIQSSPGDIFAYRLFNVPVLNVVVQGFDFFEPLPKSKASLRIEDDTKSIMAWSRGPDGDFDISKTIAAKARATTTSVQLLAAMTYDATNGSITNGDIWALQTY